MIYLAVTFVDEDGLDWADLVIPDELDTHGSGMRITDVEVMSPAQVDYALTWHNHPGASWASIAATIDELFPIVT